MPKSKRAKVGECASKRSRVEMNTSSFVLFSVPHEGREEVEGAEADFYHRGKTFPLLPRLHSGLITFSCKKTQINGDIVGFLRSGR